MAENKTRMNDGDVHAFLQAIEDERKREDAFALLALMQDVTGMEPKMWGDSIVGFGQYHYRTEAGREGDMPLTGFSPRKTSLTLYIMSGFDAYDGLLNQLGKHKTGKACLYIKRMSDVDEDVLRRIIRDSVEHIKNQ